jgi:hypothetical protein
MTPHRPGSSLDKRRPALGPCHYACLVLARTVPLYRTPSYSSSLDPSEQTKTHTRTHTSYTRARMHELRGRGARKEEVHYLTNCFLLLLNQSVYQSVRTKGGPVSARESLVVGCVF